MRRAGPVAVNGRDAWSDEDAGRWTVRLPTGDPPRHRSLRLRRPDLVPRDRLLGALTATAHDVTLLQLVAPAGYGKTTALQQWAGRDRRPVAHVELTAADNDPAHLLHHILLALNRIHPAVLRCGPDRATDASLTSTLPRLIADATAGAPGLVLVLDGLQLLGDSLGPDLVEMVVDNLAPGGHVVASGRRVTGLRLGALRSQGRCAEFGPAELALSREEVRAVLRSAGLHPDERTVEDLVTRTEGWPAGVYLTALATCNRPWDGPHDAPSSADDRFVFEYLRDEVLRHESPAAVRFLLRTAPLRRLSGALCDSVLDRTDSTAQLADLEQRHVFVERTGPDSTWYRYHPMFRELLLSDLRRWRPRQEAATHRRAAAWYEDHGSPGEAVEQALAAGDDPTAIRLATRYGPRYVNTGQAGVVRGWLESLGEDVPTGQPGLAIVAGWAWAMTGDTARALECLYAAERATGPPAGTEAAAADPESADAPADDHNLPGRVARLRAALSPFGIDRMLADARAALDRDSPGDTFYPLSAMLLGSAARLTGDTRTARSVLERAARCGGREHRSISAFALAQLSLLAADEDDWAVAGPCAVQALELVVDVALDGWPLGTTIHLANARVAMHHREFSRARDMTGLALRQYLEAPPVAFPWLAAQTALELGQALLTVDEYHAAVDRLAEGRRWLAHLQAQGALAAWARRLADDLTRYGGQRPESAGGALTPAELRVLRLLPTHLTLSEIADTLFISRNTVKTQVASVYGKLQSTTRGEAVRAARERGLVG
jgi:LuxR family transcriptional regulator, maltose regulon positive regulatory protein